MNESPLNLKRIQNWAELAQGAKWSAAALAKQCGVSVRILHRHFIKQTKQNTKTWLAEQRQLHAQEMLRNGFSIKQVAYHLGYKQQSNFSRKYKEFWGICPSRQTPTAAQLKQLSANE
jgi:transcriptional regulator GlxA family with amidase domain